MVVSMQVSGSESWRCAEDVETSTVDFMIAGGTVRTNLGVIFLCRDIPPSPLYGPSLTFARHA